MKVFSGWIECSTPHYSRDGLFLNFDLLTESNDTYVEHAELEMLLNETRGMIFEAMARLGRKGKLSIMIEVEREEK